MGILMAAEITIAGHKFKRWEVIAAGAGSLVVVYLVWRQHQAAGSSSAIDPVTGLPYSQDNQVDPLTGQTYLGEAQTYGSVAAAEQAAAAASAVDYSGSYGYGGSGGGGAVPLVPANEVGSDTYTSNAAWAQAAEAGLTDIGYSSTDIAAALGAYLGGQALSPEQVTIVQAALAEYGPPPVGTHVIIQAPATAPTGSGDTGTGTSTGTNAGGSHHTGSGHASSGTSSGSGSTTSGGGTSSGSGSTTSGGGGSTSSSGGTSPAPTTGAQVIAAAGSKPTISGGHVISVYNNGATVGWTSNGAVSWNLKLTGPGSENGRTATVKVQQASYSGLESGHTYEVDVTPIGPDGAAGKSGRITFVTTKG